MMKTKVRGNELVVLAAVLGGTNLGMRVPSAEEVKRLVSSKQEISLETAVYHLWREYMDSDDIEEAFLTECRWWLRNKTNLANGRSKQASKEYVQEVWPDIATVMGW
jgi:hypothetical protein